MPTLKQITDDLYTTLNINSDDNEVDERSLQYWVINKRAFLIRQQLEKRMLHSENYKQSIPCLELELVDRSLSTCCNDLAVGCNILRSTIEVPKLLSYKGKEDLVVRPLDVIQSRFSFVTHDAWIYSGNSRFNKSDIYATIVDNYLYVKSNNPDLQNIIGRYLYLEGIFENPLELANINDCNGNQCYSDELEFPIDQWMIDVIKQEIIRTDLSINIQAPEDKTNDSDNTESQT